MILPEITAMPIFRPRPFDATDLSKGQVAIIERLDIMEQQNSWLSAQTILAYNNAIQIDNRLTIELDRLSRQKGAVVASLVSFIGWAIAIALSVWSIFRK